MTTLKLCIGTVVDTTSTEYQQVVSASFTAVGKTVRFNAAASAVAFRHFYGALGHPLIFRAHDARSGEWRYWAGRYWAEYPDSEFRKDLSRLLDDLLTGQQIDSLVGTIKVQASGRWDSFDRAPILTLQNGTLRLEGRTLAFDKKHDPAALGTFELPLPLKKTPTPGWDEWLERTLPNELDKEALREVYGASFFPHFRMQTIGALVGKAGSGKSTATAVLRDILGAGRVSAIQANQLSASHYMPGLVGKFVNFDAESEFVRPEDEVLLKRISGGDPITINQKNQPVYETVLSVKWLMTCEELPKFSSKTDGFWSRLVIVPFDVPIPADEQLPMPTVLDRLRPEYPGIFCWALIGLQRLLSKAGTRGAAFSRSERAIQILADHRVYSNPFFEWVEQFCTPDPDNEEPRMDVYNSYRRWMEAGKHNPLAINKFTKLMQDRGFDTKHRRQKDGTRERVWVGFRLTPSYHPYH